MTKEDLIRVAREGNFHLRGGSELACNECGEYDFVVDHGIDCAVGALLKLIEEHVK